MKNETFASYNVILVMELDIDAVMDIDFIIHYHFI